MSTDFNEKWDLKMGFLGILVSVLFVTVVCLWEKYDVTDRYTKYWKAKHQIETSK